MERVQKNTSKYWLLFFVFLIALLIVLFSPYGQWFWLLLPFVCTYFALAMDFL